MDMVEEDEMDLSVRVPFFPPSEQKVSVKCFTTTTVENVKLVIWDQTDIPMKFQRLIYRDGQELEDDRTVGDYIIHSRPFGGYDMTLMVRGRGGGRGVKKEKFSKNDKMKMAVSMLKTATTTIEQDKTDFSKDFSKDIKKSIKNLIAKVTTSSNVVEKSMEKASSKSLLTVLHAFKSNEFNTRVSSIAKVLFQKEFAVLETWRRSSRTTKRP